MACLKGTSSNAINRHGGSIFLQREMASGLSIVHEALRLQEPVSGDIDRSRSESPSPFC